MENIENAMNRRDVLKVGGIMGTLALGALFSPLQAANVGRFQIPNKNRPLLLDSNENMHGYSEVAKRAIQKYISDANLYPFKLEDELKNAITSMYDVRDNMVCISNGSSESLQASVYAVHKMAHMMNKPLRIITANPTFEFVGEYARPLGIEVATFDLDSKFGFDVDAMKRSERLFDGVSLVYICNPNNPTGTILGANDLYSWVRNAKETTIFLLDEAYAEYVTDGNFKSGIDLVKNGSKNLIVVRTMSKIYGLAGLRIGYTITDPILQRNITEFLEISGINALGAAAAVAALKDFGFRQYCVNANIKARQIVTKGLDTLGLKYAPSNGNFIFHEITGNLDDFIANMKNNNIMVGRRFPKYSNFCRVTLGTPDQMRYYVKVLHNFRRRRYI